MKKFILILKILKAIIQVLEIEAERKDRQNDFVESGSEGFNSGLRDSDRIS